MGKKFTVRHYIGDGIVCIVLVLIVLLASALALGDAGKNQYVRILQDGDEVAVLPLSEDIPDYAVDNVHIAISSGRAYIKNSDCPDKVCMGMNGVSENGGGAVCSPNKVVLEPFVQNGDIDTVAG